MQNNENQARSRSKEQSTKMLSDITFFFLFYRPNCISYWSCSCSSSLRLRLAHFRSATRLRARLPSVGIDWGLLGRRVPGPALRISAPRAGALVSVDYPESFSFAADLVVCVRSLLAQSWAQVRRSDALAEGRAKLALRKHGIWLPISSGHRGEDSLPAK